MKRWLIMHDRDGWPRSQDHSTTLVILGRLDAKTDHHSHLLQHLIHLMHSTQRTTTGSPTCTPGSSQKSGQRRKPKPPEPHSDETLLMTVLKHAAPKAILWGVARIFGLLLQFAIPTLILLWALAAKWLGIGWLAVLQLLG